MLVDIKDQVAKETGGNGMGLGRADRCRGKVVFELVLMGPVFVSLLVQT